MTTDHDPMEIFRVGIEACGRVLAQHSFLTATTEYRSGVDFARGLHIPVHDIDLTSKRVVAEFRSPRDRFQAFEALRDGGYNPIGTITAP
ncbi:hypothetical protein [Nocardia flavorosea]|uniref:Uncharacterized protein n=1 Tax=Nocardia flavorosea TaxID=53429 RepID=A0A846YBL3_9NOCA|nr:hypothetical protein [Nocardia flavorosea]NKY57016.1 hypothetical protein [Nocardia flavorosea]